MKKNAILRADGNFEIGYGHIMRMMALAGYISDDFTVWFLIKNVADWIKNEIVSKYCVIEISPLIAYQNEPDFIANNLPCDTVVLIFDGYNFDTLYQEHIRRNVAVKTIAIDDFQPFKYVTDAVINHAGFLTKEQFQLAPYTSLYTGPQYAMLRNEFNVLAEGPLRSISNIQTAFVCMGGTEPEIYISIVKKISVSCISHILVVVNDKERFSNLSSQFKGVELHSNLSAPEMIAMMKQSDLAVLPPSILSYEYCSVGGGLYLIQTAENQKYIYNFLIKSGCAGDFESFADLSIKTVNNYVFNQKKYFKGENHKQLSKVVFQTAYEKFFRLRKAQAEDLLLFFRWANDPESRQNSFNKEPISLDVHTKWFLNSLKDDNLVLFVFTINDLCIGTIRFDFIENNAMISYSIDKKYRGKGLGSVILQLGIDAIKSDYKNINQINGYISQSNQSSLISFAKVGFIANDKPPIHYSDFYYYSLYI